MHVRIPGAQNVRSVKVLKNGDVVFQSPPFTKNLVGAAGFVAMASGMGFVFGMPVALPFAALGAGVSLGMQWLARGPVRIVFRKRKGVVDLYAAKGEKPRTLRFEDIADVELVRWESHSTSVTDMHTDFDGWWTSLKLAAGGNIQLTEHHGRADAEAVRKRILRAMGRKLTPPTIS